MVDYMVAHYFKIFEVVVVVVVAVDVDQNFLKYFSKIFLP
jgi:hypothetical protein